MDKRSELERLRSECASESKAVAVEKAELEGERREFEAFRAEALAQLETFREKLDVERREFDGLKAEAGAAVVQDRDELVRDRKAFEELRVAKETELHSIAAQLDEERSEFESYRGGATADIERVAEANARETALVEDERAKFESYRSAALGELRAEQARQDAARDEFEAHRKSKADELDARTADLSERVAAYAHDKAELEAKAEALEKLHNDVSRTKWRMGQERKVADEERKQLARMLLGMGEKISTNALPSDAITDTDGEEPPPKIALG